MKTRFCFVAGLVLGLALGSSLGVYTMQQSALTNELAHYNMRTGEWTWGVADMGIELSGKLPPEIFIEKKKR